MSNEIKPEIKPQTIEGKYSFEIYKSVDGEYFLAEGTTPNDKGIIFTQGKDEEEMFTMIADAYLTLHDVKLSKWSRFWHKLLMLY